MRESRLLKTVLIRVNPCLKTKTVSLSYYQKINNFAGFSPRKFKHKETLQDIIDRL